MGASVLYQSPYSPDFNPIEHWWSQLKAFLRSFSPTTAKMVDILIATALDLINPVHLKSDRPPVLLESPHRPTQTVGRTLATFLC
ncbi:MAG: transposase [Heteroscytonema crispum UTEX LB 1556]